MLALQILLATIALWSFPVASILTERDSLLQALDLANSRLRADNEEKSRMVTDLRRSLLNVEEQERLHLSHELHDQTGQPLAAALLELSAIEKQPGNADRDRMQRLRSRIEEIMQAVHRIAWQLRPAAINELGLASALGDYVAEWSQRFGITADFQCSDMKLDELSDEIRMTIYRVLGEALNNVAKHAQGCTAVSVLINRAHSRLQLIVEDDGCGFDPKGRDGTSARPTNGGLGLAGMRERLMFVGGELEIESAPGAGTTIFARIQV
jgi:signal transduction histidine kinase